MGGKNNKKSKAAKKHTASDKTEKNTTQEQTAAADIVSDNSTENPSAEETVSDNSTESPSAVADTVSDSSKSEAPDRSKPTNALFNTLRVIIAAVSAIMIIWHMISGYFSVGLVAGIIIWFLIGLAAVFAHPLRSFAVKMRKKPLTRALFDVVTLVNVLVLFVFGAVYTAMIYTAARAARDDATVVVVGDTLDSHAPGKRLSERIKIAYEYLILHPDSACVATGGKHEGESISEAQCIRDELVEMGIDSSRIYLEETSSDVREHIVNAVELIRHEGLDQNIAVATSGCNVLRCALIIQDCGCSSRALSASVPLHTLANDASTEVFDVLNEIINE